MPNSDPGRCLSILNSNDRGGYFLAHLYINTGRAIAVTTTSALSASALLKMLEVFG